ncbi:class F sortase [Sporichthya sp.]|uniref:class F sortase n=1 Tax=Sporichthya sp. TaxID=65475 RepID=UPI00345B53AB
MRIPRLGIDATLQPLHLGPNGELVPPDYGKAGWYKAGPEPGEPGEPGRAVVAGHVDSKTGPDVFAALRNARPGDRIRVRLADGSTVTFVVSAVETHPRSRFPTSRGLRRGRAGRAPADHLYGPLRLRPRGLPGQRRGFRPPRALTPGGLPPDARYPIIGEHSGLTAHFGVSACAPGRSAHPTGSLPVRF